MIDPFDAALSEFIDTLPEDTAAARQLLAENAPFTGRGDLPEFAELATMLRSVPAYEPRPGWVAASKARLMAAPLLPPEKRGFTWLGSMFLPLTQLSFPSISLPRLSVPSPVFARAVMAVVLLGALASVAHNHTSQNPIMQMTSDAEAQQAIAATQQQVDSLASSQVAGAEIQGTPRDVVMLSQQIDMAELAIEKAPAGDQSRLRSELQGAVRAVRFDGILEGITNGSTLQVSGVAVQADPSMVPQLKVGQPVSLLVTVNGNSKLEAVQVAQPAPTPAAPPSSPATTPQPAPPPPANGGGTAPQTSSANTGTAADASPATVPPSASNTAARHDDNGKGQGAAKHEDHDAGQQAAAPPAAAPGKDKADAAASGTISAVAGATTSPGDDKAASGPAAPPAPASVANAAAGAVQNAAGAAGNAAAGAGNASGAAGNAANGAATASGNSGNGSSRGSSGSSGGSSSSNQHGASSGHGLAASAAVVSGDSGKNKGNSNGNGGKKGH